MGQLLVLATLTCWGDVFHFRGPAEMGIGRQLGRVAGELNV